MWGSFHYDADDSANGSAVVSGVASEVMELPASAPDVDEVVEDVSSLFPPHAAQTRVIAASITIVSIFFMLLFSFAFFLLCNRFCRYIHAIMTFCHGFTTYCRTQRLLCAGCDTFCCVYSEAMQSSF